MKLPLKSIFSILAFVIKMLLLVGKIDNCSNFALYLDKIKISYDQSFRYSK